MQTIEAATRIWLLPPDAARLGDALAHVEWPAGRTLADELPGRIEELLKAYSKELTDLTGIVVYSGPGSFTSLRILHATANALLAALAIPGAGASGPRWDARALAKLKSAPAGPTLLPVYGAEARVTKRLR